MAIIRLHWYSCKAMTLKMRMFQVFMTKTGFYGVGLGWLVPYLNPSWRAWGSTVFSLSNFNQWDMAEYSRGQGPSEPALGITETCKLHHHGIVTCPRLFSIRPLFQKFFKNNGSLMLQIKWQARNNLMNKCTVHVLATQKLFKMPWNKTLFLQSFSAPRSMTVLTRTCTSNCM